jgi:hypothetical protein
MNPTPTDKEDLLSIRAIITWQRDTMRAFESGVIEEFMLRNGREFQGRALPARYRRRAPKMCFYNARQLVLRSSKRLRYCEGYVLWPKLPLLIHHAWAIDEAGRVVDPTLARPQDYQFFGIILETDLLRPRERIYAGLLTDPAGCWRLDFMRTLDPETIDRYLTERTSSRSKRGAPGSGRNRDHRSLNKDLTAFI